VAVSSRSRTTLTASDRLFISRNDLLLLQLVQSFDGRAWALQPSCDGWYPPSAETVGGSFCSAPHDPLFPAPDGAAFSSAFPPFRLSNRMHWILDRVRLEITTLHLGQFSLAEPTYGS
jgi:hypothetical protein